MNRLSAKPRKVYFIRPTGKRGPVKIGWSGWPEDRRKRLERQVGAPLEVAAQIVGRIEDERLLHQMFAADRTHGEWFAWSRSMQRVIDAISTGVLPMLSEMEASASRAEPEDRADAA